MICLSPNKFTTFPAQTLQRYVLFTIIHLLMGLLFQLAYGNVFANGFELQQFGLHVESYYGRC